MDTRNEKSNPSYLLGEYVNPKYAIFNFALNLTPLLTKDTSREGFKGKYTPFLIFFYLLRVLAIIFNAK